MTEIPEGALLQKSKNGVSYVFFPSYYYDRNATTHNKEKQRRLYIGKVVNGHFIPNKRYKANPHLSASDAGKVRNETIDLSKVVSRSTGATSLLASLAEKVHLKQDLIDVYGEETALQLLSLALFMVIESNSSLSLYPQWQPRFRVPSDAALPSQAVSRLLMKVGQDQSALHRFFHARTRHVRAKEFLAYDSTKIASTSRNIDDVRWAPSKQGHFQQEIGLAILCGQKSRIPVMFRILPGNIPDVKTVHDLICRWDDLGITREAVAVLDRGYDSYENLAELCRSSVQFIAGQKTSMKLVRDCIDADMPKYWESAHYMGEYGLFGVTRRVMIPDSNGGEHPVWVHTFRSNSNESLGMELMDKKLSEYEKAWADGTASATASIRELFMPSEGKPGDGSVLARNFTAIDKAVRYRGFFAFVSNSVSTAQETLSIYRGRDCIEKTFSNLQAGLGFVSTSVHRDDTLKGKLLVCMIALTMVAALSYEMEKDKEINGVKYQRLYEQYSLKQLLSELMNIQMFSGEGITPRLSEITQKQLQIFDRVGVPRPSI